MKKIFQYIMLAVVTIVMASCTSNIEETTATTGKNNVQVVVGEFPAFGDSQTRAIGTPDEGKTSWAVGDELLLEIDNTFYGKQYATFTYNGKSWELTSGELVYREGDPAYIPHVYYAPNYKWEAGKLVLKEGKVAGTDEYIEGTAQITPNGEAITVKFSEATRNYSRLRIATMPNKPITVSINKYTPAGSSDMKWDQNYALTSDEKGNAYLYGNFVTNSLFTVKYEEAPLATYKFSQESKNAKSYALDATVISVNSAEEIKSAIDQEIADGKTSIRLNLAPNAGDNEFKAIREALTGVKEGTIDLALMGGEQIPTNGLKEVKALKSISLPDVTTLSKKALYSCVNLQTVNAPKVTAIDQQAFYGCNNLRNVILGTLTDVRGAADSGNGIFDGIDLINGFIYINLLLHESQEIMKGELDKNSNQYIWKPSGVKYFYSNDSSAAKFLGYYFRGVKSWE